MKRPTIPTRLTTSPALSPKAKETALPVGLVVLSISSVQIGAAFAKELFQVLGPVGAVGLRALWTALVLLLIWRTRLRGSYGRAAYGQAALFGVVLAAMNLCFYLALNQLPLGITVTLEFTGPLLLAVVQSRKVLDILWVVLAACGILLLAPIQALGGTPLSIWGIVFALLAGALWAAYILLSARVGSIFPGGAGLALAAAVAAVVILPFSIAQAGTALLNPIALAVGAFVGIMSSALPYSLEMEALKHLPSRVFSILLSLEPVIAALIGLIILHEELNWRAILAIILISAASAGTVFFQAKDR